MVVASWSVELVLDRSQITSAMLPIYLATVGIGLITLLWSFRGRRSRIPALDARSIVASAQNVKLRKTRLTSVSGSLYVTHEVIVFQVNLGRVPMSYDRQQVSFWNLTESVLDLSTSGIVKIDNRGHVVTIENVSSTCFNYLVRHWSAPKS